MTIEKITNAITPLQETEKINEIIENFNEAIDDSNVVHKTGTETIAGEKTFTSKLRIDSGGIEITPESSASHGGYIDFHYAGSTDDYTSRIIENSQGNIAIKSTTVTVPTPTETTTTTGQQSASTGWVNTVGNNVMHLSGAESVNGDKTFNDVIISRKSGDPAITCDDPAKIKGTAPSSSKNTVIRFRDKNGNNLGAIYHNYGTDKKSIITLQVSKASSSSDTAYAHMGIYYPASGNPYTYAPPSDVNGSIVTTVNKSKSANGYFKLGNGLIVQWGVTSTGGGDKTVTLPTAFTSTNYSVSTAWSYDGSLSSSYGHFTIKSHSTTNFVYHNESSNAASFWIAIGY